MTIHISPGAVLTALVFAAIGAGVAVGLMVWEPWDGDGEGTMTTEQQATPPARGAPTQAEREAEEVSLCLQAQQAAAEFDAAREATAAREEARAEARGRRVLTIFTQSSAPDSVQAAIDRYCK